MIDRASATFPGQPSLDPREASEALAVQMLVNHSQQEEIALLTTKLHAAAAVIQNLEAQLEAYRSKDHLLSGSQLVQHFNSSLEPLPASEVEVPIAAADLHVKADLHVHPTTNISTSTSSRHEASMQQQLQSTTIASHQASCSQAPFDHTERLVLQLVPQSDAETTDASMCSTCDAGNEAGPKDLPASASAVNLAMHAAAQRGLSPSAKTISAIAQSVVPKACVDVAEVSIAAACAAPVLINEASYQHLSGTSCSTAAVQVSLVKTNQSFQAAKHYQEQTPVHISNVSDLELLFC